MANEWVCIERPTRFARRIIAAGAVLPFGTAVYLSGDPNTVAATSTTDQSFAGVVWERVSTATSTHTEITVALDGVWDVKATTATITLGLAVAIGGANLIQTADAADLLNGAFVGVVEETVSTDEVVRTRVTKFGSSGEL